jgi:hypothetical protein
MAWYPNWFSSHKNVPEPAQKETPMREAAGAQNIDVEMEGFRPISGDMNRNLSPLTQSRMRKVAANLWEQNLLANRLIEIPLAYLLAEGVWLQHEDPELQNTLDRFWNHPINNMDMKLQKRMRELGLFGELFIPAFVNDQTGAVRLSYLDVEAVKEVIFDPDNHEQAIGVITHRDKEGNYKKYKVIINGDEDDCFTDNTVAIREQFDNGELFYFAINTIGAKPRGRSDLLAQADYLDIYDHMLYGEADRIDFLRAFVWHFKIEGADQTEIDDKWKKTFSKPPAPSSTLVTNEKVTMEAKSPSLNASETDTSARLFRNHILGGGTVPEQIFGGGGDVNRSTGETMMEPFEKVLTMRQNVMKEILRNIGIFVLRQHVFANGAAEPDLDDDIYDLTVNMPEMTAKDTTKYASALQQVVTACSIAERALYITRTTAIKIIDSIAGRLGIDIDAKAEMEAIDKAQKDKPKVTEEADVFTDPAAAEEDAA